MTQPTPTSGTPPFVRKGTLLPSLFLSVHSQRCLQQGAGLGSPGRLCKGRGRDAGLSHKGSLGRSGQGEAAARRTMT